VSLLWSSDFLVYLVLLTLRCSAAHSSINISSVNYQMCTMFIIEKTIAHSIPNKHQKCWRQITNVSLLWSSDFLDYVVLLTFRCSTAHSSINISSVNYQMCTMFIIEKMIAHSIPNKHQRCWMQITNVSLLWSSDFLDYVVLLTFRCSAAHFSNNNPSR
jgi:hypothetical protein